MKKLLFFSCFLYSFLGWGQTNIVTDGLNNSTTLFTLSGGAYFSGNSTSNDGPASSPYAIEGTHSRGVSNGTATLTSSDINTSSFISIEMSFRLASFSISNGSNGADNADIVTVEVSPNGGTDWYSTVRVRGNSNAWWSYAGGTGIASTTYDGNAIPVDFQPAGGGSRTTDGYSTVTITGLPAVSNLRFRITLLNDNMNERWVLDDFKVTGIPSVTLDGIMSESDWGSALATSSGGPSPGFGADHVINALYSYGDATHLYFGIAGNVQSGNRILLFIDSRSGGYNNGSFGRTNAPQGIDDWNNDSTFDNGFNPDYCAVIGTNGSGTYFLDLFRLEATGVNTYLGANGSADFGVTVSNTDNTRGFEFRILKTALNYTANQELQLFACYISDGGSLSNQFLTRANNGEGNYGGGAVNFGAAAPNPVTVPYNSKQTGNWNDGTTWRLGTASPTNVSIGILNGHNVTVNVAAGNVNNVNVNSGGALTISGTNTLTMNNNLTYTNAGTTTFSGAGTLNIGTGATFTNSGTYTAGSSTLTIGSGTFNNSGTFTAGTGTVNINGATTINNNPTFNNLNYSGGLTLAGTTTVNGTLRVNSGGFISSGIPIFGSSSTLEYLNVSGYGVNNEWTSNATTAGNGTPQTVILNNSSINMPGGARSVAGNITIGTGSTLNLNGSFGADLNVGGNWTNSGTLNANSRAVTFRGNNQSITGATTFAFLTHNSSGSAGSNVLTINDNITVNNQLNLNNGLVTLASGVNVSIANNGTIAATSGNFNSATTNGTITFTGAGTTTGTVNFYPAVVQSPGSLQAVSYSINSRIHNTLTLNSNSFLTNAPSYSEGSTLIYNSGGNYTRAVEWGNVASAFPTNGFPHHVRIQGGTTLNVETGLSGTLRLNGNLTLGNTGSAGSLNMQATSHDLEVRGNIILGSDSGTSTLTLSTSLGSDLFVAGNWNRTANGTLVNNSRLVEFNGTSLQTINDANTFDFLAINNATGVNLLGTVAANQSIRLTNGNFTLGSVNRIGDSSLINFNGGTFRTSASGAGFSDVVGAMNLTENSTLQLGTGDHTITFANSTAQTWTSGRVLTINGWTGTPTASGAGSAGKIQVGVGGLTAGQLEQIQFTGFDLGAVITASGELVPRDFPTFYSKGSLAPNLTTSWSRTTDGTGASPLDFTAGNTRYIIQNGHHMTTSAAWSITGANSILRILDGGTLQSTFAVTVPSTATFEIQDGGTYIHDNNSQPSTSILAGTELFSSNSNFEIRNWTNSSGNFDGCSNYGNININCTIDTGNSMNFLGSIQNIFGDLTINNSAIPLREVRLTASATNSTIIHGNLFINDGALVLTNSTGSSDLVVNQNFTQNNGSLILSSGNGFSSLVVNGNVNVIAGILRLHSNTTGIANFIVNGENFNLGQNVNISPSPSSATIPGNSGFYFNRNGVQNVSIGQAFVSGNYRDRFFYNASQTTINETYNGTVAQETVNGNGATPLTGYSAWPTSGDHLRNLTINNTAGVTLRNNRSINENLVLTNGTLTAATNTTLVFQGDQISRTNGSLNFAATGATLEMNNNTLKTFPTGLFSSSISNLHINGSGGVKANQDLNITNNLSLNQSNPNLTDGLLDMVIDYGSYATTANPDSTNPNNNLNSYTLNMVGNATTIGNGDVTGKIRRTGIVSGTTYTFGNKNMQLTFNGTDLPTYVEIVATKGDKGLHVDKDGIGDLPGTDVSPIGGAAVKRLYQIKRSGGDTPTTFTIRLPYNTDELNGNSENDLVIWDHHLPYNGVTPHEHGKTSLNTSEKYIELAGHGIRYLALDGAIPIVGTFSTTKYWMISQKETTDVLWLGAATDDWNIPSNWTSGSVPDFDTKIVIPQVPTYQNELQVEGTVEVASIDVKNNASFVAKNNAVVQVKGGVLSNGGIGSWNNQGNFVAEPGSKIIFENPNATVAGNSKFHDLEVKNGGKLTIAANTVVEVVGNLVNFGELDANSTENTIRFVGTNQTIPATNGLGLAYRNIEINQIDDSSEVTMTGSIEINGTLSIPSGKLKVENNTLTLRGAFPEEAQKIITTNQSRLEFRNSGTGTKVIPDFSSINNIVVDTNLQLEASANLNVHGNINVNKGTLNLGIFNWNRNSLGGTLSLGNQGKLLIGGNNTLPSSFSIHDFDTDSEVAYVGGNQTIKKPTNTYGNLRLAGTGDKMFEESESLIEVSKDLLIEGGHLKVGEDKTLKVTNQFNNLSGLATFETGASLLQVNNVVNNGNITYKRTTGDLKNFDFVYWGTMVHNPLIKDMWMTNASETFYRFNPVTNNWVLLSGNTPMTPGIGYIARARFNPNWGSGPTPPSALPWTATYIARPNNGNVEVDIFQDKFHLIANPYPSALDAKEFIQQGGDFTSSPFLPTIFIWTQASGINNNQYQSSDYAAFNLFTETPDALNPSGYTVSRYVGAGQGFFVRTKNIAMPNPAKATFTNNHRVAGNNENFTKPAKTKNQINSEVSMQKYWLKLTNTLGNTKQTAIVHHPEGSISYDPIQDSPAFNGNATLNLFSLFANQRMAVNVTSPIQITDEIPIGYTTTQAGSHILSLAHLENISENQEIYLLDQVLSITHNIKEEAYTFNSLAGTFNERFKIVFQNQTLSTPEIPTANWIVFAKENNIHIQSGNELIDQISIYDLNGRLLYQKQNVLDNELLVPWNASNQILLVKIIDINGISYKTKVLLP